LAQIAAIQSLDDQQHLAKTVQFTVSEKDRMRDEILSWGIAVAPSSTNFLFIDTEAPSIKVANYLLSQNVMVKAWRGVGYESFIRVSIGHQYQNELLLRNLKNYLSEQMLNFPVAL
jgi:histidinol-phosphate aminotransferase